MREEKKEKILLTILVIIIILVKCGGVFAYLDIKTKKEIAVLNDKINIIQNQKKLLEDKKGDLENQLQDLKEGIKPGGEPESCGSNLTSVEKEMAKDWKRITNSKYNFSFKYPKNWSVISNKNDLIELRNEEADINFKFAAQMPSVDMEESYKKEGEKTTKVFCNDAKRAIYSGENNSELITVLFKKDSVSYAIILGYKDVGASMSSDIVEAFDLILKTIEF